MGHTSRARNLLYTSLALVSIVCLQFGNAATSEVSSSTSSSSSSLAPPTPVFVDNYAVHGVLSLPYAELNEPFVAYFDKANQRSRTDYYGDDYMIYQFGSKSSPKPTNYGVIYKLAYVPADFNQSSSEPSTLKKALNKLVDSVEHRVGLVSDNAKPKHKQQQHALHETPTRRACFSVQGGVGYTIRPQTVLPDLSDFTYDSTGRCPNSNFENRHAKCELWKLITNVGDKKNTYKFWVRREAAKNMTIPVHYYMLGYDSLLGSHYDRYDISYYKFTSDAAVDEHFALDVDGVNCGPMPGPGDSSSEQRAHLVLQNPIHEYVTEPHRYDHIDLHFDKFAQKHEKNYTTHEHHRQGWFNFLHNFRFINGKNRELKEYKLNVNRFADNNVRELGYLRGRRHSEGYNGGLEYPHRQYKHFLTFDGNNTTRAPLPESFDWTAIGAVTPVKDQAVCGSCWSFGTVGSVEGNYFAKTGKLLKLSQQQLIDCSWKYGNNGCDGGEDFRAYKYIVNAGGLSTEDDYGHYMGIDGKCHDQDVERPVKINGFYNVTTNNPEALKHAIYTYGPVSVSIDASRPTFTFYSHGAYYDEKCQNSPDNLDHSVLVVGYMKLDNKLVWKVKNSWSTYWGNDGYIYMSAEKNNCGVLDAPTVPLIEV